MKIFVFIIRLFSILIFVLSQQGLIIGIGALVYFQSSEILGMLIWILCIPMLYVNYLTARNVMKYGLIDFLTMNVDTSEIDVPKGKRWYDEGSLKE